ncbi:hypothetical protein [Actinomadura sp. WMMA1423]|uniref:hypothetical protein n=1 Tax=Actinomadura sp. WMMA1423 TaxID=2591108 RepID=UPI001146944A|nr:hypothetical protein [Actinomadura sp. WMMA1423]
MAGTLSYRLEVAHVYQRRFDCDGLAEALSSSHWYIITRRPALKIVQGSVRIEDRILTADFATRPDLESSEEIYTFGSDFSKLGDLNDFRLHEGGAYFSVSAADRLFHGDAWALASLLSGADAKVAGQEVLYVGQAFGQGGGRNAWERTQNHKKLQRIYEDHVDSGCEIFVAPLVLERSMWTSDDHIEDTEAGPDLSAYLRSFADPDGRVTKPAVDLIEHSLISYFVPPYNEKLREWRAANPTGAMRKMRSAGFRLLHVHLSGWQGLARFYSAHTPDLIRSHFISQDVPPEPRRPVLRGITAENLSDWRFDAMLVREGKDIFADAAERSGAILRVFGDEAPQARRPPGVRLVQNVGSGPSQTWQSPRHEAHERIRESLYGRREERRREKEGPRYGGPSYDSETGAICIGEFQDGQRVEWRLHDPLTGTVDSGLIVGARGQGKSNLLRLLMFDALSSGRFFLLPSDPSGRNEFQAKWASVCHDRFVATDLPQTIANLEAAVRIIDERKAVNEYTKPSRDIPGVLVAIDDADAALQDKRGARLVSEILASGGQVGVGLLVVVSDLEALERNPALMRALLGCSNQSAFQSDGYEYLAEFRARYGDRRPGTWKDGEVTFVVHHGEEDTTLGVAVGVVDRDCTVVEAQSWCAEIFVAADISVTEWTRASRDPFSWWTFDPLQVSRWCLRQHEDAWVLVKVLGNSPCSGPADALRWAAEFMAARFTATLSPWQLGPSVDGAELSAYYADVEGDIVPKDQYEMIRRMLLSKY